MGIVNASPDSFSDGGRARRRSTPRSRSPSELLADGADILDIGGESASTGRPPVAVEEEIERVVPLVERVAGELGALVSVDTYKPPVARAAIAAGASIVNDVSGLRDPELADVCAQTGAALVRDAHARRAARTPAGPRPVRRRRRRGARLPARADRRSRSRAAWQREQLIVDPGPDFAKTPAQTIRLLARARAPARARRPLLMAISRKDFIGALTGRAPRERLAGTLAALAHGVDAGAHIFRVHDVAAAADFLAVRAALSRRAQPSRDLALAEELRHDRLSDDAGVTARSCERPGEPLG